MLDDPNKVLGGGGVAQNLQKRMRVNDVSLLHDQVCIVLVLVHVTGSEILNKHMKRFL